MKKVLIVISTFISILPVIAMSAYMFFFTGDLLKKNIKNELINEVDITTDSFSEFIAERLNNVRLWSELGLPKVSLDFKRPEALNNYLASMKKRYRSFDKIIVLESNYQFFSVNNDEEIHGENLFSFIDEVPVFQRLAREMFLSGKSDNVDFLSLGNNKYSVYLSSSILDENKNVVGFFVGRVSYDAINKFISRLKKRLVKYNFSSDFVLLDGKDINYNVENHFRYCKRPLVKEITSSSFPRLCISIPNNELLPPLYKYIKLFLVLIFSVLIIYIILFNYMIKRFLRPFYELLNKIYQISGGSLAHISIKSTFPEINDLVSYSNKIIDKLKKYRDVEKKQVELTMMEALASQVAHDIMSPLATLNIIMSKSNLSGLSDSKRRIINSSLKRIYEISDELLSYRRSTTQINKDMSPTMLTLPITSIVNEKRAQYKHKKFTNLVYESSQVYGIFSNINEGDFKRVLSNIINNAFEAISENGKIVISLTEINPEDNNCNAARIRIWNNGDLIPESVLIKLGIEKVSNGKSKGNGIGIYSAKKLVDSWNGTINFVSNEDDKTYVDIILPISDPPKWFVNEIDIESVDTIVILDDDEMIHSAWEMKVEESRLFDKVKILKFTYPESFIDWFENNNTGSCLFLIDYDYSCGQFNGKKIIKKLGIESKTFLVTNKYEDRAILEMSKEIKGLIPKVFMNKIIIK